MDKILYFENLYSKRREYLINKACELQNAGKNFLYILPSREAIKAVRYSIIEKNKGMMNSKVIMFDEFERDITEHFARSSKIIHEDLERLIIADICSSLQEPLLYFEKIKDKRGFQDEVRAFIKYLKINCVDHETLENVIDNACDTIFRDKLKDVQKLCRLYASRLLDRGLYDINDISILAAEKVKESGILKNIDSIFIDGFINIDKVNLELIRAIAEAGKVNLYINCPYKNVNNMEFITREIYKPFTEMNFEICEEGCSEIDSDEKIKELAMKFYCGEKADRTLENIYVTEYPCIHEEVRESARSIKQRLIEGENPEEIVLYVNNIEDYSDHINSIFGEFELRAGISMEMSLSNASVFRQAIELIEKEDCFIRDAGEGLILLAQKLEAVNLGAEEIVKEAFNNPIDDDKLFHVKAIEALKKLITELTRSFELCGILEGQTSKEAFIELIKEYAQNTKVLLRKASTVGIKILNTDLAKGVYYKHVYILGLKEGELPRIPKNEGLFDELEVHMLKQSGISYKDVLWELQREKIRFNLALASALTSLNLSYRSADEEGKFAIQSSFLEQVRYVAGTASTKKVTMRDRFELPVSSVMSREELKAVFLKNMFEKKYKGFETGELNEAMSHINNLEMNVYSLFQISAAELHRNKEISFNRYEGILTEEYNRGSKTNVKFSSSKVSSYFSCPFGFMVENIFELKGTEEEGEEYSTLEISQLYRNVLRDYYKTVQGFENLEVEILNKAFISNAKELRTLNIEKEKAELMLGRYLSILTNFINLDIARLKKYNKETGKLLMPYIIGEYLEDSSSFEAPLACKIDRVDLEYEVKGRELVPTGKYAVYGYKKDKTANLENFLSKRNSQIVINYFIVDAELKRRIPGIDFECIALLYLNIEGEKKSVDKDGIYRSEYKTALDCGSKKFDLDKDMFRIFTGYMKLLVDEAIDRIDKGVYPFKLQCSAFDKYRGWQCPNKNMCRYSESKMEVMANE
jgi:ATP-dependent helicase/nuclease subunit B